MKDSVVELDPDNNRVMTRKSGAVSYDFAENIVMTIPHKFFNCPDEIHMPFLFDQRTDRQYFDDFRPTFMLDVMNFFRFNPTSNNLEFCFINIWGNLPEIMNVIPRNTGNRLTLNQFLFQIWIILAKKNIKGMNCEAEWDVEHVSTNHGTRCPHSGKM